MNIIQKFFHHIKHNGALHALLKVKYYIFRSIYLCLCKILPASCLKHILTSEQVTIIHGLSTHDKKALEQARKLLPIAINESHNVTGKYTCIHGENVDFSHKEVVIIAHWDMDDIIDPYVVFMCQGFMNMGKMVILASAHPLMPCPALENYNEWCHAIICRTCDGYDFTSWKATLDCFPSIYASKELILANDSNFGPMPSFTHVHKRMQSIKCDFWGMNFGLGLAPALQSFYLVFKPQVIQHAAFKTFFANVPLDNNKEKAVLLEASMTLWLAMHGFSAGAYCTLKKFFEFPLYLQKYSPLVLLEFGVPLLKRLNIFSKSGYQQYMQYKTKHPHSYPWELIDNYLQRTSVIKLKEKHDSKHG